MDTGDWAGLAALIATQEVVRDKRFLQLILSDECFLYFWFALLPSSTVRTESSLIRLNCSSWRRSQCTVKSGERVYKSGLEVGLAFHNYFSMNLANEQKEEEGSEFVSRGSLLSFL